MRGIALRLYAAECREYPALDPALDPQIADRLAAGNVRDMQRTIEQTSAAAIERHCGARWRMLPPGSVRPTLADMPPPPTDGQRGIGFI